MKKIMVMVIAVLSFFVSGCASIEGTKTTGVGAATGGLVGAIAGSQVGGGKGGSLAGGIMGMIIGSLVGGELENNARALKDPMSHRCEAGWRPVRVVSGTVINFTDGGTHTVTDTRACLLNEGHRQAFNGWQCKSGEQPTVLAGGIYACLQPSLIVEASTIRQQTGYTKRDPNAWWPCEDPSTGQAWQEHPDGTSTRECYKGYAQQPQPGVGKPQKSRYPSRGLFGTAERHRRTATFVNDGR